MSITFLTYAFYESPYSITSFHIATNGLTRSCVQQLTWLVSNNSFLCSLSLSVCAADYSIKPKVTELTPPPTRVLLVGNSFMYYNCGVNGYISGLSKSLGIKISTTMATIGGAGLDWHLVKTYLRKDGLASYSTLNCISFLK